MCWLASCTSTRLQGCAPRRRRGGVGASTRGFQPRPHPLTTRPRPPPARLACAAPARRPAAAAGRAARQQQQHHQQQLPRPRRGASLVAAAAAGGDELVPDSEFAISKISFGSILTPLGCFLLVYGFGAYFMLLPGSDLSSLMLIYGFPISVLGFALSYAQLEPVGCK